RSPITSGISRSRASRSPPLQASRIAVTSSLGSGCMIPFYRALLLGESFRLLACGRRGNGSLPPYRKSLLAGNEAFPAAARNREGCHGAFPALRLAWKMGNGPFPADHEAFPMGNVQRKVGDGSFPPHREAFPMGNVL